jgi:nucleoid-associated protein YgaU
MADETHDEDTAPDEELNDDSNDRSEEKPAKKKRKRRSGKKKREVTSDTESSDTESSDTESSDTESSDTAAADDDTSDSDTSGGEETAKVEEPPPPPEPDDPNAVQALKDIGARLETNEEGNVWRVFFYEDHTDADVTRMHSLHSLKQVWVIGSKATPECVTQLREQFPNATVYA